MPFVHVDSHQVSRGDGWESPQRAVRMLRAFVKMIADALVMKGEGDDWLLLLEDDLVFHPQIAALVFSWKALEDSRCGIASLFNGSIPAIEDWGKMPRAFAAEPERFLGTQAILLRRQAAAEVVSHWDKVEGMQSQRMTRILCEDGPLWIHRPSLVQHVASDSSWGGRVTQALDFDPEWEPTR